MPEIMPTAEKRGLTRDRIVGFLLKHPCTIAQLAEGLDVTPNAVRAQMALLEREGIVEVQGALKGTRRPSAVYGIRAGAEVRPSRAYPAFVSALVGVLGRKLTDKAFASVMQELGKQLADAAPKSTGDPRQRVEAALRFLASLGSVADMAVAKGKIVVTGHGCPIAKAIEADERSCIAMARLLQELTGLPVAEHCDHGAHPSCRFEITIPGRL